MNYLPFQRVLDFELARVILFKSYSNKEFTVNYNLNTLYGNRRSINYADI